MADNSPSPPVCFSHFVVSCLAIASLSLPHYGRHIKPWSPTPASRRRH